MNIFVRNNWKLDFLAYGCAALLIFQIIFQLPLFTATDLPSWGDDWKRFLCKINDGDDCDPLSKFPLAYFFNSAFISLIKLESRHFGVFLVNCIFLFFSVFFVHHASKKISGNSAGTAYFTATIFTIIPPFYIYSGAIEVQYGVVLGVFLVSLYLLVVKRFTSNYIYSLLFFTTILLPFYKDISFILIGFSVVCVILVAAQRWSIEYLIEEIKKSWASISLILAGLFLSFFVVAAYNFFRYKSVFPLPYIDEASNAAPPFMVRVINLFWLFFSPNGGLIFAWSAAFIVLLILLLRSKLQPSRYGVIISVGVVGFSVLILANWWTPFGWEGWGNRLILPSTLAALLVISGTSVSESIPGCFYKKLILRKNFIFALFVFIISLFYIEVSYSVNRDKYLSYGLWGTDSCKAVSELRVNRPMWEFKRNPLYLKCHQERFSYLPGIKMDMSPLSVITTQKYVIKNGRAHGVIGQGWSNVEDWGVWSEGNRSEIRFLSKQEFSKLFIELKPFIYGSLQSQKVIGKLFGQEIFSVNLTSTQRIEVVMPKNYLHNLDNIVTLELILPNATSPQKLNLNNDGRLIAVGLLSLELQ